MKKLIFFVVIIYTLLFSSQCKEKKNVYSDKFYVEESIGNISLKLLKVNLNGKKVLSANGDSITQKQVFLILSNNSMDTFYYPSSTKNMEEIHPNHFSSKDKSGWGVNICVLENMHLVKLSPNASRILFFYVTQDTDSVKLELKSGNKIIKKFFNVN